MKPIKERLSETKPGKVDKITKAFEKGGCSAYQMSFMQEATSPSAMDFPKASCLVTNSFFCCYGLFEAGFFNMMTVIPINQIVNLYRTNVDQSGKYDFKGFHLAIEMSDGTKTIVSTVARNRNGIGETFEGVISCVRSRQNPGGVVWQ